MKKKKENKDLEIIEENDIRESNKVNNTIPVVNIYFNENGILNFKINENMNKKFLFHLYMNLLNKLFIKLLKNILMKIQEDEKRTYKKIKKK